VLRCTIGIDRYAAVAQVIALSGEVYDLTVNVVNSFENGGELSNNVSIRIRGRSTHNRSVDLTLAGNNATGSLVPGRYRIDVVADGRNYHYYFYKDLIDQIMTVNVGRFRVQDALNILRSVVSLPVCFGQCYGVR
jgi:hypothetical protein